MSRLGPIVAFLLVLGACADETAVTTITDSAAISVGSTTTTTAPTTTTIDPAVVTQQSTTTIAAATTTTIDPAVHAFQWFEEGAEALQAGNDLSRLRHLTRPSGLLAPNRIGANLPFWPGEPAQEIERTFRGEMLLGMKWLNSGFDWFDWDVVEGSGSFSEFHITPEEDAAIDELVANGVKVMATLMFWDEDLWIEMGDGYSSRFTTDEEIERWLDYVRFIVAHFEGRIEYYQLWNEPMMDHLPMQYIELADYIELVRRTVPVIRQEDPDAKIAVGALHAMHFDFGQDYMFGMISSDIMPLVDVVSWHPFYGSSPSLPEEFWHRLGGPEYYYGYPALVEEIRDVATAHGFAGEYFATEMIWWSPSSGNTSDDIPRYSEIVAAKYYARGIVMHLGMDITVGVAEEQVPGDSGPDRRVETMIQNLSTIMAGAEPTNLNTEILSEATDMRSYGFALPDGDRLLALWTDGVAQDDNPGVEATLIIPGLAAQQVTAIDPLNTVEQQLVATVEDGLLVIRGLLVKDYPIILRFAKAA